MGADSPETLERLSHSSPLISNDWLIQGSRSLDLLLQCGTTLLGEVSWIRLTLDITWEITCCLTLLFPICSPHSFGECPPPPTPRGACLQFAMCTQIPSQILIPENLNQDRSRLIARWRERKYLLGAILASAWHRKAQSVLMTKVKAWQW